jgi:hypothetical protein
VLGRRLCTVPNTLCNRRVDSVTVCSHKIYVLDEKSTHFILKVLNPHKIWERYYPLLNGK